MLGPNFNSSIICCLSSGDIYLFLWVVLLTSSSVWLLLCNSFANFFFEALVILSTILLPIKSTVASAVFWIGLFDAVFITSVVDFLVPSRNFWPYLLLKLLPMFLAKDKNPYPFTNIVGSIEYLIFIIFI